MNAKQLHSQAEQAREKGDFTEALVLIDRAIVAYLEEDNLAGLAEVIASRFLTNRHLYEATGNKAYLVLAKHAALASVELADLHGNASAKVMPLFNLAKAQETLGQLSEALISYDAAIGIMETTPPQEHDRPAVLADMKIHLGICRLKNGDPRGLDLVEDSLDDLAASDELKYNKDVWLSGGHIKLAEVLLSRDKTEAKEHLDAAKVIIDANPDLTLRARQWQKLSEKFN